MGSVWSFDLGKASIGEAVRDVKTNRFLQKNSFLIPEKFASTKAATTRRRMWRTREAHKARETWLDEAWRGVGQEPLRKREVWRNPQTKRWELKHAADERLAREFPKKGDTTCYTSCLLRIKLLRGDKLEPWQIYKALRSAIQRRGYDPDIPWKARETSRRTADRADEEEAGTRERMEHFVTTLNAMFPDREDCRFPSYFDAVQMGLCDSAHPDALRERISVDARSTRDQVVPRRLVEKELRYLLDAAGEQVVGLKGRADYILWGPGGKPYASYFPALRKELGLREGGANDWQGVLGQKVPRFDNRIIEKCVLIPRLNVCKIKSNGKEPLPESRIAFEATFLMKLKNMRVRRSTTEQSGLTAAEIRSVFQDPKRTGFKVTVAQWRKYCATFGVHALPGYEEIEPPRSGGRSRFCRPALEILKRLILEGVNPVDFYKVEAARLDGNTNPSRGLVSNDLRFLLQMGSAWEGIYIPNQKLDAILHRSNDADEAVREIIGSQNDPIVRHRLGVFYRRIHALRKAYGVPETVVLEFVREDFMGRKAIIEYRAFLKKREGERKLAREDASNAGARERSGGLKLELLRAQGGVCLYTGEGLQETKLDQYEIDHVVPRSQGGPDAVFNYALTTHARNADKGNRTPFEWLSASSGWDAYVHRVRSRASALRNKKVKLLLNEDAAAQAERYTALAETAWISKLARAILDAFFGWRNGNDAQGTKRIVVVNGGLTARIRRNYKLNRLLNPDASDEEDAEKKNRNDNRHHALDAMVINFIPGWTRDAAKEHFFRFPPGVNRDFFARDIAEVIPRNLAFEKAELAETIYGARRTDSGDVIVQRVPLLELAMRPTTPGKSVFDTKYLEGQIRAVRDLAIAKELRRFTVEGDRSEAGWRTFCGSFQLPQRDGTPGSRVLKVTMNVGAPDEYLDMSKDGGGAFRKGKKGHKGQLVYLEHLRTRQGGTKEVVHVRPVYAFQSAAAVASGLRAECGEAITIIDFFQSGCLVELTSEVFHERKPLPPGRYKLNSIRSAGEVVVSTAAGVTYPMIPRYRLTQMVKAGLRRVHEDE